MKKTIFIALIIFLTVAVYPIDQIHLIWPIDRPVRLSGTFGEYRGTRYHYGIDIGCEQQKGFRVFAAQSGSITRIQYQNYGIGYCVYITHNGGFTTLYGHLDRYADKITNNSLVQKYRDTIRDHRDFRLDLPVGEIPVRQGDVIAFSGDSGMGPEHLHFELADPEGNPINPLTHGLFITDNQPPVITRVLISPLDSDSNVEGSRDMLDLKVLKTGNVFTLERKDEIHAGGKIGIRAYTFDTNEKNANIAVYSAEISINGQTIPVFAFNSFSHQMESLTGLAYDYSRSNYSTYCNFFYDRKSQNGVIDLNSSRENTNKIEIIVKDASGNKSVVPLVITKSSPEEKLPPLPKVNLVKNKKVKLFSADKRMRIEFPEDAAMYNERITIAEQSKKISFSRGITPLSKVYKISPDDLYIEKPARIVFPVSKSNSYHAGVYSVDNNGIVRSQYSQYDKSLGALVCETFRVSGYLIARDESIPFIKLKKSVKKNEPVQIRVGDSGSGVDTLSAEISVDGKPVAFYFDIDRNSFIILPHNDIYGIGDHTISVRIKDYAGNQSQTKTFPYTIKE